MTDSAGDKPRRGRPPGPKVDKPKRPVGRPPKPKDGPVDIDDDFIENEIAKRNGVRRESLDLTYEVLRIITECAKRMAEPSECAAVLGVSHAVINEFFNTHQEARDAWDDGLQLSKVLLRSKQFKLATKNQVIAIFLGKNMLGQKDTQNIDASITKNVEEMSEEQLIELAARAKPSLTTTKKQVH